MTGTGAGAQTPDFKDRNNNGPRSAHSSRASSPVRRSLAFGTPDSPTPGGPRSPAISEGGGSSTEVGDLLARLGRLTAAHGKLRDEVQTLRTRADTMAKEKADLEKQLETTKDTATRLVGVLADSSLFQSMNRVVLKDLFANLTHSTGPVLNRLSGELAALRGRFKLLADAEAIHARLLDTTSRYEKAVDGWRRARERIQLVEDGANGLRVRMEQLELELRTKAGNLVVAETELTDVRARLERLEMSFEVESNMRASLQTEVDSLRSRSRAAEVTLEEKERELREEKLRSELLAANLSRGRETAAQLQDSLAQERLRWKTLEDQHAVEVLRLKRATDEALEYLESVKEQLQRSMNENESLRDSFGRMKTEYSELVMFHQREVAQIRQTLEETRELHRGQIAERGGREARIRLELTELQNSVADRVAAEAKKTSEVEVELAKKTEQLAVFDGQLAEKKTARVKEREESEKQFLTLTRERDELAAHLAQLTRERNEAEARHKNTLQIMSQAGEERNMDVVKKLEESQLEMSGLRTSLDESARALDEAHKATADVQARLADVVAENDSLKQLLGTIQADVSGLTGQIEAVAAELDLSKTRLATSEAANAALQTRYEDLVASHGEATAALEQHAVELAQLNSEAVQHRERTAAQQERIVGLERDLEAQDTKISKMESEHAAEVAKLALQVTESGTIAADLSAQLSTLQAEAAESRSQVNQLTSKVAELEKDAQTRIEKISRLTRERDEAIYRGEAEIKQAKASLEQQIQRNSELELAVRLKEEAVLRANAQASVKVQHLTEVNKALESQRDRLLQVAEKQEQQTALDNEKARLTVQELNLKSSAVLFQLSKARDTIKALQLQLAEAMAARDDALREVETLTKSVADAVSAVQQPDNRDNDLVVIPRSERGAPSVATGASSVLEQAYDMMLGGWLFREIWFVSRALSLMTVTFFFQKWRLCDQITLLSKIGSSSLKKRKQDWQTDKPSVLFLLRPHSNLPRRSRPLRHPLNLTSSLIFNGNWTDFFILAN